jgi:hypothetical protein
MAEESKDRPLLVESVPGERAAFDLVPVGQAMAFLGSLVVIACTTLYLLSGPNRAGGWEGTWFLPRTDFELACPAGLAVMLLGVAIYYYGLSRERRPAR